MIIMDMKVVTAIDDGVASIFLPTGEVLNNFFVNELVDGGGGDFVWGRLDFIHTY